MAKFERTDELKIKKKEKSDHSLEKGEEEKSKEAKE